MRIAAIIAAAGIGKRMGAGLPKQYIELGGKPIICHTLDRFRQAGFIDLVVIAAEVGSSAEFKKRIMDRYAYPSNWVVVDGGGQRQDSVSNALAEVRDDCDVVMIHDGVRPFISVDEIRRCADTAHSRGACIVASPIAETVKQTDGNGVIVETVDRSRLYGAKTPQAFRLSMIREAMRRAYEDGFYGTDDAQLVERLGKEVAIVEGNSRNIKITTPSDLAVAEIILKEFKG